MNSKKIKRNAPLKPYRVVYSLAKDRGEGGKKTIVAFAENKIKARLSALKTLRAYNIKGACIEQVQTDKRPANNV